MSTAIILSTHGNFAEGILQSSKMIFGKQEKLEFCVFSEGDSPETLSLKIEKKIQIISEEDQILFLVDLYGGTPFNVINKFVNRAPERMAIIAGLNLPLLIQALIERTSEEISLDLLVSNLVKEGKNGVRSPDTSPKNQITSKKPDSAKAVVSSISTDMGKLGIRHVRLDERLIHGQVATLWLGSTGATRVMIVDDEVVRDEISKASLKTAVPGGVKLSILKVETAARRLKEGKYQGQKIFLITKKIETIFNLIDFGVPIDAFNLGNSSNKENAVQITKSIFLTQNEIKRLQKLESDGVLVTAQMVPMEEAKPFSKFYKL